MRVDQPEIGYYQCKAVRGGPWLPVRIWYDEPEDRPARLCATIDGEHVAPDEAWIRCASHPISREEWRYLSALSVHAKEENTELPQARPGVPINLRKVKPVW